MTKAKQKATDQDTAPPEEPQKPAARWLDFAEEARFELALSIYLLKLMANIPGIAATDAATLEGAAKIAARTVQLEIGRQAYDAALDAASDRYAQLYDAAREQTIAENGDEGWQGYPERHEP